MLGLWKHRPPVNSSWFEWIHQNTNWTPASPTRSSGLLPHTWLYPDVGLFQDNGLTTPAIADNDSVGGWTNQGSDDYSIIQATGANKPTLKLNIRNERAVLRFDGNDWLQAAFDGGLVDQPFVLFVVAKLADAAVNDGSNHVLIDGDDAVNRAVIFQQSNATPDSWTFYAGKDLVGSDSDGNWDIFTVLFNGMTSHAWINGVSNVVGDAEALGLDGLTVGAVYNNSNPWIGDVAEILLYTANLSNSDKNQVGRYCANKFAISYTDI